MCLTDPAAPVGRVLPRVLVAPTVFLMLVASLLTGAIAPAAAQEGPELVRNGGFEEYVRLPTSGAQLAYAIGWTDTDPEPSGLNTPGTPDFFHLDGTDGGQLPRYFGGDRERTPYAGGGIAGFYSYGAPFNGGPSREAREYLQTQLLSPLVVGRRYRLRFAAAFELPGERRQYATKLGALLTVGAVVQPPSVPGPTWINGVPTVETAEIIDGTDWRVFELEFTACEPATHLTLGNFRPDACTERRLFSGGAVSTGECVELTYHFLDEVSLREIGPGDLGTCTPGVTQLDLGPARALCRGAGVLLDAGDFPGATFAWGTGETTRTIVVTEPGDYAVRVETICGPAAGTFTVEETGAAPVANLGPRRDLCRCSEGLGVLALNPGDFPGATFAWSTGETTPAIDVSDTGTYSVTVTNACGSSASSVEVFAFRPLGPDVDIGPDRGLCGGPIVLDPGEISGATFAWNNGATTRAITVTEPGEYRVIIQTACGTGSASAIVAEDGSAPAVDLGPDRDLCTSGGAVILDAGDFPDGTYAWSNGATTRTTDVTAAGTYAVTVTTACGSGTDEVSVTGGSDPAVDLGPDRTFCAGTPLALDAGEVPGATYAWSTGATTRTIDATAAGTYAVTVVTACGEATDEVVLTTVPAPSVDLGADRELCPGTTVTLDAGDFDGATYAWSTGETTRAITADAPGTYAVTVTTACGAGADEVVVTLSSAAPIVELGPGLGLCPGQVLSLDAGTVDGATYLWSTGETTQEISVETPGEYAVTVTTACGTAADEVAVAAAPEPSRVLPVVRCEGASYTFAGVTYGAAGEYEVSVPAPAGDPACDSLIRLRLEFRPPRVDTLRDTLPAVGPYVLFGEDFDAPGTYVRGDPAAVQDVGCPGLTVLELTDRTPSLALPRIPVAMPTAFSPNGDGLNDRFFPRGRPGAAAVVVERLQVFDRWGGLLYTAAGLVPGERDGGWDGTADGRELDAGVFVWTLRWIGADGAEGTLAGEVQLVR